MIFQTVIDNNNEIFCSCVTVITCDAIIMRYSDDVLLSGGDRQKLLDILIMCHCQDVEAIIMSYSDAVSGCVTQK